MTCTAFLLSLEMNRMFISRTDIEQTQNVIFFSPQNAGDSCSYMDSCSYTLMLRRAVRSSAPWPCALTAPHS